MRVVSILVCTLIACGTTGGVDSHDAATTPAYDAAPDHHVTPPPRDAGADVGSSSPSSGEGEHDPPPGGVKPV